MTAVAGVFARRGLLAVAAGGFLMFAALWTLSMTRPHLVEASARTLLVAEVERRAHERLDTLSDHALVGLARAAMAGHAREAAQLRRLREALPARVQAMVDAMADPACACRESMANRVGAGIDARLRQLAGWDARIEASIRGAYAQTAARLQREFRIFTGTNALAFLVLGAIAWRKPAAALHLLVPGAVLLGAVTVSASFYLFNQDWVRTIVFNEYVGYGYAAWLGVLLALLADILANRARVTTRILNGVFQLSGSALSAMPC